MILLTFSYITLFILVTIILLSNIRTNYLYNNSWVNSLNLLLVNYLWYFVLIPIIILISEKFSMYHQTDPFIVFSRLMFVNMVFLIFFLYGYSVSKIKISTKLNLTPLKNNKKMDFIIFFGVIIILLISFRAFFEYGIDYYIENISNRINLNRGKGYYLWGLTLAAPLSIYYFDKYLRFRSGYLLTLFIISFVLANAIYIILGFRGRSFLLIVIMVIIYSFRKKIKLHVVAIICALILPSYLLLGNIREGISGENHSNYQIQVDSEEYIDKALNSFGVSEYLSIVLDRYSEQNEYQGGRTLISLITLPIPNTFFENKPYGSGPIISNVISPGIYNFNQEGNSSFTLSLIGEIYINFGYLGIPIFAFLFGVVLKTLDIRLNMIKNDSDILIAPLIVLIIGLTNKVFVGEFLGAMAGVLFELLPILLFVLLEIMLRRKKNESTNRKVNQLH